jgi:hypothetical protein
MISYHEKKLDIYLNSLEEWLIWKQ